MSVSLENFAEDTQGPLQMALSTFAKKSDLTGSSDLDSKGPKELLQRLEEATKWRVFAETVKNMRNGFSGKSFNTFTGTLAKIYDDDLDSIYQDIDESSEKYHKDTRFDGQEDVKKWLDKCRLETAMVNQYYGKTPDEHRQALQATINFRECLKKTSEYIDPICAKLNPASNQQAQSN